ncbi:MAG TPA: LD-carboxypeptidase [Gemmatimonadales bacterium]|nr:LD-carboxypeptidase [Gemmatimonadales bacterium]
MIPKLVLPPRLQQDARIALIAPSGPLLERDDRTRAAELCSAMGYQPEVYPNAGNAYGYLAGRDDERLADLNSALADPDIDAVWCIRGGNGMNRIIHRVDFDGFARNPKPVIGYSDITVLLLALWMRTGVVTFHGPIARTPMPNFQRYHFDRILTSVSAAGTLGRHNPPSEVLVPTNRRIFPLRGGRAEGPLVGGNLTLLQALIGTAYFPPLDGAILFIEDVGEDVYRVDRMLAHLRLVGAFDKLAGVAIGQFTDMGKGGDGGALGFDEVLETYFGPLGIPVAVGFPFGHIDDQWTLPIGVRAALDADKGELSILGAAVRS